MPPCQRCPVERAITTHAKLNNGVLFSLSYTNGVDADQEKHFGKIDIVVTGDAGVIHAVEGPLGPGGTQIEIISGGERRQITAEKESRGPASMFYRPHRRDWRKSCAFGRMRRGGVSDRSIVSVGEGKTNHNDLIIAAE